MKITRSVFWQIVHSERSRSLLIRTAFILAVFTLVLAAATVAGAQTYTDLYNFDNTHGADPQAILAQGRDGNLYGTTYNGGTKGTGEVFQITPSGSLTVLHNFDGGINGGYPQSGLTLGTGGNFYGTTYYGGANEYCGTIFKITPRGNLTTLYSFTGGNDGEQPFAPPIQGTDGSFYGTANRVNCGGCGTVYKITPSGTLSLLGVLGESQAPLLQATDGNFYGTTYDDGGNECGLYGCGEAFNECGLYGCGEAFKVTPKGALTTIYSFDITHGAEPDAPLIQGNDGNFYGTAYAGGSHDRGVVFELTPSGAVTVLHNFGDLPHDGYGPQAGLVQATDGNFYGVTYSGGTGGCSGGCGVIFQITAAGDYSILYNFDGAHGEYPTSTPMQHTNGKIYGLASAGGTSDDGVVYSFDMGLGRFVSLVSTTGKVGKTIEVLGQGFTGTTAVAFNGTAATFTVVSDTYLKTTVPSGATTGFVTVTTPSGTLTSNREFRVKP